MSIDNERAKFEAWAQSAGFKVVFESDGKPKDRDAYHAWIAWLARAQSDKAVSVEALEELCDKVEDCFGDLGWSSDHEDASKAIIIQIRALIAKETGNG